MLSDSEQLSVAEGAQAPWKSCAPVAASTTRSSKLCWRAAAAAGGRDQPRRKGGTAASCSFGSLLMCSAYGAGRRVSSSCLVERGVP